MADNFISYNRFTGVSPNISEHGSTIEELKSTRGTPNKNPVATPMAAPLISQKQLFLRPSGSDQARLSEPTEPDIDPYEGPQSVLSLSRSAAQKLNGPIVGEIRSHLASDTSTDAQTVGLQNDSLKRVESMTSFVNELNQLKESIYVATVNGSRS